MKYIKLENTLLAIDNILSIRKLNLNPNSNPDCFCLEIAYLKDDTPIMLYWNESSDRDKAFAEIESKLNMV